MGKKTIPTRERHTKPKKHRLLEVSSQIIVKKSKDKIVTTLLNQNLKSIRPKQTKSLLGVSKYHFSLRGTCKRKRFKTLQSDSMFLIYFKFLYNYKYVLGPGIL